MRIALAAVLLATGSVAPAHHSFAAYDQTKTVTLRGTVKEFRWVNPHVGIVLAVNTNGQVADYLIAGGGVAALVQAGWRKTSLNAGDAISISFHPTKDGQKAGELVSVQLANGRLLGDTSVPGALGVPSVAVASRASAAKPAAGMSKARLAQSARLPDWSGLWRTKSSGLVSMPGPSTQRKGKRDNPPYKPAWEARYVRDLALAEEQGSAKQAEALVDTYTQYCNAGVPRNIANGFDRHFIVSPEMVWMINGGEVRVIYTDGRQWPAADAMFERFQGWSLGHWETDTLVVETRGMKSNLWGDTTPLHFSDKAVLHERYRMTDQDTIVSDVTIVDAEAFNAPWKFSREYQRQEFSKWADEKEVCGGSEDFQKIVNGRLQVAPAAKP